MQQKNNDIIKIEDKAISEVENLKPHHFEYLGAVLDKMYRYQYRHLRQVKLRTIFVYAFVLAGFNFFLTYYVEAKKVTSSISDSAFLLFSILALSGATSIISKCISQKFNFKICLLRIIQAY